jgi:threonylcarbamoyladenosine tRNA methylthiotransferase MtaB
MIDNTTFNNRTALFHTFGCKLNFAETSTVARLFAEQGIRRISTGETPDIIVINTCSVTEVADKKCRQTIRSFHKRYPDAAILVTGCYAQLKADLLDYLKEWKEGSSAQTVITPAADIREFNPSCSRGDRTRYFLKVQDGCDYWCSYCTIPKARGRSRSGTIAQMVEQAQRVAAEGGKEIVLTGVNIGDFGKGRDDNFFDLIRALDEVEGIERYRISSIEPNLLTDEIIDFCAASKRFMPHFHVPLQCGSDEVLKLMRRHYDTDLFRAKIEKIRATIPHAFIGVDLIVGARGETPELFKISHDFCESIDISRLHVFAYSERPGTRALEIAGKVEPAEQHRRTCQMLALSEAKLRNFSQRFVGTVRPVLLEHPKAGHPMSGFTDNYLKIEVDAPANLDNTIVPVRLDRLSDDGEFIHASLV